MDNLGEALKLRDKVLEALKRPVMLRSRGYQIGLAIRTAVVIALALVDIAGSLRVLSGEPPISDYEKKEECLGKESNRVAG